MPSASTVRMIEGVTPSSCSCDSEDAGPRVLVAVRHPTMRRYAAELLGRAGGCWVSTEITDGEMLPPAIARFQPDVLVVDAGDFPACCQAALEAFPRDRVVVIGPEPDPSYGAAAIADGAAACVTRDNIADELAPALRAILGCLHDSPARDVGHHAATAAGGSRHHQCAGHP